ncbi:MAG: phage integrase N-terminal SAM-like domain-containing protein [Pseudomonadota bacterium]
MTTPPRSILPNQNQLQNNCALNGSIFKSTKGSIPDSVQDSLKNYGPKTVENYTRCCRNLAKHYMRSPEQLEEADIRAFLLYLVRERKVSAADLSSHLAAIKVNSESVEAQ